LRESSGVFAGESVIRRLERLAQAVGLQAAAERDMAAAAE
jgi:exopolyphosphatase / guanosine-5'-triphosphate,3'-diphosphate pyrophosphatase